MKGNITREHICIIYSKRRLTKSQWRQTTTLSEYHTNVYAYYKYIYYEITVLGKIYKTLVLRHVSSADNSHLQGEKLKKYIQGYSKWFSGSYTIQSRCNPMWFISMGLRQGSGLCSSSSRRYPGTVGTNQNRHWNHHRWHAKISFERIRLSCWFWRVAERASQYIYLGNKPFET